MEGNDLLTVQKLENDKQSTQILTAASLFALYLILGSMYYTLNEDGLTFIDSIYFLIISFTTTG